MAAPRLSVNDNGTWKTVNQPHVADGGSWQPIHKVWIRDANTWKLAHKTAIGQYSAGTVTTWVGDGTGASSVYGPVYTVPDNGTRYLKVTIVGQSGGGGGGAATTGQHSGKHITCSYETFAAYSYSGGYGGRGRHYAFGMEVTPGDRFQSQFWYPDLNTGGSTPSALYLPTYSGIVSAGTQLCGSTGNAAWRNVFGGYPSTYAFEVKINGSAGGVGACVKVQSNCFNDLEWGYDLPGSGTGEGADGAVGSVEVTDTASAIIETYTNEPYLDGVSDHDSPYRSGPGGSGLSGSHGTKGNAGYISVEEFTASPIPI